MKINRHGRAKVLTFSEIELLFNEGLIIKPARDRALFAVCLYTACRIRECVTLEIEDVFDLKQQVRPELIIKKGKTKGKLATRTIPVVEDLRLKLEQYRPELDFSSERYVFPGRYQGTYLHQDTASWILREACKRVEIEGASTHSFRRTALTQMSNAGIPLRVIQEVSGHRTLDELYKYLEVRPEQVKGAVSTLSMLTPPSKPSKKRSSGLEKSVYNDAKKKKSKPRKRSKK